MNPDPSTTRSQSRRLPCLPALAGVVFFFSHEAPVRPGAVLSRQFDPAGRAGQRNPPALSPVPAFGGFVFPGTAGFFFFLFCGFARSELRLGLDGAATRACGAGWSRMERVYSCRVLSCLCVCTSGLGRRCSLRVVGSGKVVNLRRNPGFAGHVFGVPG